MGQDARKYFLSVKIKKAYVGGAAPENLTDNEHTVLFCKSIVKNFTGDNATKLLASEVKLIVVFQQKNDK